VGEAVREEEVGRDFTPSKRMAARGWRLVEADANEFARPLPSEKGQKVSALSFFQFDEDLPRHFFQRFKNAAALEGHGFEYRLSAPDQMSLKLFRG
jgi:hypothetical protein